MLDEMKNIERKKEWGTIQTLRYETEQLSHKLKECEDFMAQRERDRQKVSAALCSHYYLVGASIA